MMVNEYLKVNISIEKEKIYKYKNNFDDKVIDRKNIIIQ